MFDALYTCAPSASLVSVVSLDSLADDFGQPVTLFLDQNFSVDDPATSISGEELVERLRRFIIELPPNLQELVHRHYWLGQSQADIAADLGVTRSAVCHALARVNRMGRTFFGLTEH